jgi:hypothetical protein
MMIPLLQYRRPVFVCGLDIARNITTPALFYIRTEVQVELAIDDGPGLRICVGSSTFGYRVSAVAAILRRITLGITLEDRQVFGTGELVNCTLPLGRILAPEVIEFYS